MPTYTRKFSSADRVIQDNELREVISVDELDPKKWAVRCGKILRYSSVIRHLMVRPNTTINYNQILMGTITPASFQTPEGGIPTDNGDGYILGPAYLRFGETQGAGVDKITDYTYWMEGWSIPGQIIARDFNVKYYIYCGGHPDARYPCPYLVIPYFFCFES